MTARARRRNRFARTLAAVACIAALGLLALLLVGACGGSQPQNTSGTESANPNWQNNSEPGQLTILGWSGQDDSKFYQPFPGAYPDVKLKWTFMASSTEGFTKFATGYPADIICITSWCKGLVDRGLIQPIDTTKLSNWKYVPKELAAIGLINGKQWGVPVDYGTSSITVRSDKISPTPDSWNVMWDPKYKGKVAMFDSPRGAFILAEQVLGIDTTTVPSEADQARIQAKLVDLIKNCKYLWSDQSAVAQDMKNGTIWAAYLWQEVYLGLKQDGVPVVYVRPKELVQGYQDLMEVSSNTKNYDQALALINAFLDPKSQTHYIDDWGYGPANSQALPLGDPKVVADLGINDPNWLQSVLFYPDTTDELMKVYSETWNAAKAEAQ
jgi:spermidine/putrescine transport system substrate-binding protein